ncbi:MAG TPA: GDP-mannose 4,6-dehydratase [Methanoregula sp.]|nr:GDP-mannose 4,6-dehydratase [Methanoregula sp.]
MEKILVTGASGFAGGHFIHYLLSHHEGFEIHGVSRSVPAWDFVPSTEAFLRDHHFHRADLTDAAKVAGLVRKIQPDFILHLAAQSSVAESWRRPVLSFLDNATIFLNIIDAVRLDDNAARVLSVGSSEQYGSVAGNDLPLRETHHQCPASPYAVARVAQEQLAGIYAEGYGLGICCTRSFNHCGPGQDERFVVSSLVKQSVLIEKGLQEPVIHIGNGAIIRDFVDVRDVVRAYFLLLKGGKRGEVYNICSGTGRSVCDIVLQISDLTGIRAGIVSEDLRIRPSDNPRLIGDNEKIFHETGWAPEIPFEQTLEAMIDHWRQRLDRELKTRRTEHT